MNSVKLGRVVILTMTCASFSLMGFGQQSPATPPRSLVLEVMYAKGSILTYQRIGEWTSYEGFRRISDWKPRPGEVPVTAVKIASKLQEGSVRARVTVLRGKNHDSEEFVVIYTITPAVKSTIQELAEVGVEPFEIQLVQASSTVPDPPTVENRTKSLDVSVESGHTSLPTFTARITNNSSKPVASFSYITSVDGRRRMSAQPINEAGGPLIKPGATFQRTFRFPTKTSTVSTGEVPPPLPNVTLNITAVVFTDGSFEGDACAAASYLTVNAGEKALLRRLLDLALTKDLTKSEADLAAALASVDVDAVTAEVAQKFPTLTSEQRTELLGAVDIGKSRGMKFFRKSSGQPTAALLEDVQKRIEILP